MRLKGFPAVAVSVCALILVLACLSELLGFLQRLEWITFDWRVRQALSHPATTATNLGFVFVDDDSVKALLQGDSLPYRFGPLWPRHLYGYLLRELRAQDAKAVAFDVLFLEERPDHDFLSAPLPNGTNAGPDAFFAWQLHAASNVFLASEQEHPPAPLFRTNAAGVANAFTTPDVDGVLRRVPAFHDIKLWHPFLRNAATQRDWKLDKVVVGPRQILIPTWAGPPQAVSLDEEGRFNPAVLYEELMRKPSPARVTPWVRPFSTLRAWHIGILLAARELGLDLEHAEVDLAQGRIVLRGPNQLVRVIPVDREGRFYVDWRLTADNPALTKEPIQSLLEQDHLRHSDLGSNAATGLTNRWRDKLVLVGSIATGGNMSDLGATPLEKMGYRMSVHWNVANTVITQRFIRPTSLPINLLILTLLGLLTAVLTWRLRVLSGALSIGALAAGYTALALWVYIRWRIWLPMASPLLWSLLLMHLGATTARVLHEQAERRHLKGIFARVLSPAVFTELLQARDLSLGGTPCRITVAFADIRGFTKFTDEHQSQAENDAAQRGLSADAAAQHLETEARRLLQTVNTYLGAIATTVKRHEGTLDKYIGDCVMAFWGAPTPNDQHAPACVQAMIETQQAIHALNEAHRQENQRRETQNLDRRAQSLPPLEMLALLEIGIGINTGSAIVGLMGSEEHVANYTAFGREVNVASRLESQAKPGRILISEATYTELRRFAPALADLCTPMPDLTVKGIHQPIRNYSVSWENVPTTP